MSLGVSDFRFLASNDCYVCTKDGSFYRVCVKQTSRAGRKIKRYETQKLNGSIDRYGYVTYRIMTDSGKKHLKAHREMLLAWKGASDKPSVNHKDGDKLNNSLDNLEWCTVKENNEHAIKTGLLKFRNFPERHKIKLFDYLTIYILKKHVHLSNLQLAEMNNCSEETIRLVINRVKSLLEIMNERKVA